MALFEYYADSIVFVSKSVVIADELFFVNHFILFVFVEILYCLEEKRIELYISIAYWIYCV